MKSSLLPCWEHFSSLHADGEKQVLDREGSYQGLSFSALYTSIEDLSTLFNHPLMKGTFVDLGCGSGLAPLLYASLYPDRKAIGIEFEEARLEIGNAFRKKHQIENVSLLHEDLRSCELPGGDVYFLYFPTGPVLDRILSFLYSSQKKFLLVAIESHGDLLPRLALENWLSLREEVPLFSQRHYPKARFFERQFIKRSPELLPFENSFLHNYLLIEDQDGTWIGETFGMEWVQERRFELMTPPRTVLWGNVVKLLTLAEIDQKYHPALMIRKSGEVEIRSRSRVLRGVLRKIMIRPTFHLEISTGEKVEWEEIMTITQGSSLCYESSQGY